VQDRVHDAYLNLAQIIPVPTWFEREGGLVHYGRGDCKSGLPDLRTMLRNPGKRGLCGEVALPNRFQRNKF